MLSSTPMCYLHTWGQTLSFHPHIHCIIPARGLSPNNQWIKSKKNFFIPVRVIANMFRGKFLAFFKKEVSASNIKFYADIDYFNSDKNYQDFVDALYNRVGPVFRLGPLVKLHVRFLPYTAYRNRCPITGSKPSSPCYHDCNFTPCQDKVSSPEEFHLQALSEPDVNLSAHPAPIIQPLVIFPSSNVRTIFSFSLLYVPSSVLLAVYAWSTSCIFFSPSAPKLCSSVLIPDIMQIYNNDHNNLSNHEL